jgi:DNA-binding Lrp family transcriptional regulator
MAVSAYILINVDPARTQVVLERLRAIPGAVVREVLGPYDIVVELERDTPEDLTAVLRAKIRSVPGVTSTVTCTWL